LLGNNGVQKTLLRYVLFTTCFFWAIANTTEAGKPVPLNQFSIGDSIGEGEAAGGTIGQVYHDTVWSTGYNLNDIVYSLNERFQDACPTIYHENNAARDVFFNHAVSGSIMADFVTQVNEVVVSAGTTLSGKAGMVTILLGNNDVCASSLDAMTDPVVFEAQYRSGLDVLAASDFTKNAYIHVSSIPAIYWLWNAMREDDWCRIVWSFVPCQNLLSNPENDCGNGDSHLNPNNIHYDDGPNCVRRKHFHAKIRDIYNPILRDVLQEYKDDGRLPNAYFIDVFDIKFEKEDVNDGDCFHPSLKGHALLAEEEWSRTQWGVYDPLCRAHSAMPWIPLLLLDD